MFRKPPHTKPQSHLRSSDRRKLRTELSTAYPNVSPEAIAALIPLKESKEDGNDIGQVCAAKFVAHGGEQGVLYSVDGQPVLWRDLDGGLRPTVYTLWKIPDMLPTIMTHGPVMQKLFDGADLMLPGVIIPPTGFPTLKYGDTVSITIRGNPMPMAVGTMVTSTEELETNGWAMRGKGVRILHTFGDCLWGLGDRSEPPDGDVAHQEVDEEADTSGSWTEVDYVQSGATSPIAGNEELVQSMQSVQLEEGTQSSTSQPQEPFTPEPAPTSISPAEMDALLETAFLTTLKSRLPTDPKTLPMTSSMLYSNYIIPSRPRGVSLEIKQSTYKKVGKFLKAMEKRGLIKLKERGGEMLLVGVNRNHPILEEFVAPRKVAGDEKPKVEPAAGMVGSAGSKEEGKKSGGGSKGANVETISTIDLYKAGGKERRFFEEIGISKDTLFTVADLRAAVKQYAETKDLIDKANPRMIKIDPILCDAVLFKPEYNTITHLPRDTITQRLRTNMQPWHQLIIPGREGEIHKGTPKPITITLEQRAGHKMVTKISGMEHYGIDPEDLAGQLKIKCASSTSITTMPGKQPLYEVMVQGNKVKEVCGVLEKECRIGFVGGKSRVVEVVEKGKKK